MNKYKLIKKTTGEEHICEKVVVDGWDYYVSDEGVVNPCYFYNKPTSYLGKALRREGNFWVCENIEGFHLLSEAKKVIATNNPSIDISKVVDEVEKFENEYFKNTSWGSVNPIGHYEASRAGYNKSQETHPFSEEDMIEFAEWLTLNTNSTSIHGEYIYKNVRRVTKELIQIWKEQRTKTLYYE